MSLFPRPFVALIGRTNVGKSTLFNRLIEEKRAITSPLSGTTRDRNFGVVTWRGKFFTLIDTGGLDLGYLPFSTVPKNLIKSKKIATEDIIELNIVKQAEMGIKQANLIIMVVDSQVGIQREDRTVVNILRKSKKPFLLVANKADNKRIANEATEFINLGLGQPITVSASNGSGTGDLLDAIEKKIELADDLPEEEKKIIISFVGKPNVGKSSLLNSILNEERVVVSSIPHTTREAQSAEFRYNDKNFILTDLAGIRRGAKMSPGLEKIGVNKSLEEIKNTDVCFLVLDISQPLSTQDARLSQEIIAAKKAVVIVANKWDLVVDKDPAAPKKFTQYIYRFFPQLLFAPIVFVSSMTGQRVRKTLDLAIKSFQNHVREIEQPELTKLLKEVLAKNHPLIGPFKVPMKFYSLRQVRTRPPAFQIKTGGKTPIPTGFMHFILNKIKDRYDFSGTPVEIFEKKK